MNRRRRELLATACGMVLGMEANATGAESEAKALEAFKLRLGQARAATAAVQAPYLNKVVGKWARRLFTVEDLKYDVTRTTSLVSPLRAVAEFRLVSAQGPFADVPEDVQIGVNGGSAPNTFMVRLTFQMIDGVWKYAEGEAHRQTRGNFPSAKLLVTRDAIAAEPEALPFAALRYWVD